MGRVNSPLEAAGKLLSPLAPLHPNAALNYPSPLSHLSVQLLASSLSVVDSPARSRAAIAPSRQELEDWFKSEIQPHERSLRGYLRVRFPRLNDLDDLVQESFARATRIRETDSVSSPKSLLFTIARNLAFSRFRHDQVVSVESMADLTVLRVLEDAPDAAEHASRSQEIEALQAALRDLPARCREVLILRMAHGLKHCEIAAKLRISENTVNNQLMIGYERCRRFLGARGITGAPPS